MRIIGILSVLGLALIGQAHANNSVGGDIAAGKKVFKQCQACHVAHEAKNKTGPHLLGILGRPAGSLESYTRYSEAMKDSGLIWDEETLDGYLKNPKKYLKGTKMVYRGLKRDEDRHNVIAYLKSFSN